MARQSPAWSQTTFMWQSRNNYWMKGFKENCNENFMSDILSGKLDVYVFTQKKISSKCQPLWRLLWRKRIGQQERVVYKLCLNTSISSFLRYQIRYNLSVPILSTYQLFRCICINLPFRRGWLTASCSFKPTKLLSREVKTGQAPDVFSVWSGFIPLLRFYTQ